ncbi:hypothetical protein ACJIZ3_018602 [Penstemon smallii]|uniref:DNA-directed RNA polymerase subunit n=1 Tax=Penstemon smallii TaxID=265156 RepID=A0ABD3SZB0_9LAMI
MEETSLPTTFEAKIRSVTFGLATRQEICKASISDCPISHASQLSNPFLGLPLETGKCESCGTGEPGQCEGHFGYIELPTPIYHPDHVNELKRLLSLLCLKCLKMKNRKVKNIGLMERVLSSCCEETSHISINEVKTTDGAYYLELKIPSKSRPREGTWNFLEKYGFRYGDTFSRPLLPSEVMAIFRKIPLDTRNKLHAKGYFPQDGYILQHLPVPPNCLSVPDVSDGISTMSTDHSISLLKKVLRQVEIIKNSRSGVPNFESQEIEGHDLQAAVAQYLQFRGTGKATRDVDTRFGVNKDVNASSTKAWLEKMKTLFIRKGSGFSSRSVITGDPFKGVSEIGLPFEIAQKITFEERVNQHNMEFLQKLVDEKLCLTYRDGSSTYSLKEGSKGHTFLRPGQVVHRRIMDGDIVFINRPPTTHKHSLQALSVYIHDDHTVKINPLICGPLSADFDGDCIHLFYPQSLEAKAEVVELFSVEKQLLSSHTGNFNLQLTTDSLLSLKIVFRKYFLNRAKAQQLAMFVSISLPKPAVVKSKTGPLWTASQILQSTLPLSFDCSGERHAISKSEVLRVDFSRDVMTAIANDIVTSLFFLKGPKEVLRFFNSIQPLLMENLFSEGFSVSLRDFCMPGDVLGNIQASIQQIAPLLKNLHGSYNESIALQLESYLRTVKIPVTNFILKSSAIGNLIESKSESAISKVVQQIGFLGMQISDRGKFYTGTLVKDMSSLYDKKYTFTNDYLTEKFGLVSRPLFQGLDPYQEMVHSISSREVIVRSSRGLTEPGTLFKNLMAILRDVVICHDGTVRNTCSNSIIQFEYGVNSANIVSEFCAGDPVGVLAATAMSNPAYKAVLDSSPSSNSSWDMMKEILLCGVRFKNDTSDRRVILYLKDCDCGRKHCQENAAFIVKNHLKKVSLKDTATEFLIEYRSEVIDGSEQINPGLVGHIHLDKTQLAQSNISLHDILEKCEDTISKHQKKKKIGNLFKRVDLSLRDCCTFCQSSKNNLTDVPCIQFLWLGANDDLLDRASHFLADTVYPALLQTIIKGDPRVSTANIVWASPDTAAWIRSPCKSPKGELVLDVTLEKEAVKKSGDAWRIVMDSCLSIFHLIDTQRSMPYAIKQVQELLGISCAFEQAVQRLSTSVTMVTKDVLKDHLLLLGNSMTCAGTLIGFNSGGIKSLSKSLNVQVPFMDATLFTPRKNFEKAAEKCHADNLSSIVASCAWGKHVSVGTGSPFEILWDTRKAELNSQKEIDVYDFLHLVSGSSKLEDKGTGCLGEDIEDLIPEDEFMEFERSPERESGQDKPTFEDELALSGNDNDGFSNESTWGKKDDSEGDDWTRKTETSAWGKKDNSEGDDWTQKTEQSAWGKKVDSEADDWSKKSEPSAWGKKVDSESDDQTKKTEPSTWGKKVVSEGDDWSKKSEPSAWSKKVDSEGNNWKTEPSTAWGKKVNSEGNDWTKKTEQSTWGSARASAQKSSDPQDVQMEDLFSSPAQEAQHYSAWGNKEESNERGWLTEDNQAKSPRSNWAAASGKKEDSNQNSWGNASKPKPNSQSSWGRDDFSAKSQEDGFISSTGGETNLWEANQASNSKPSSAWGKVDSQSPTGQKKDSPVNTWSSQKLDDSGEKDVWSQSGQKKESPVNDWSSANQKQPSDESTGWGSLKADNSGEKDAWSQWGQKKESTANTWGSASQKQSNEWGSPKLDNSGESSQRGRGRGRGGRGRGRAPSNGGEWKNDRPRTAKPVDDPNAPGIFTMTRQRLDLFTVDEQDVLSETEAIMKNIRRIMSQTGYTDGDPLSADDQKYIIDNVLNYHPDKASKMGGGIDYIMVNKHGVHTDTRCFFAVSVDGSKEDFSYRKCLENLFAEKYPNQAESFLAKYFRKNQPRGSGWNKERGTPRGGEAGTPVWSRGGDQTPGPDDGGSSTPRPSWSKERGQNDGNTPGGWNSDNRGEAGTWNADATRDEAGTQGWKTAQTPVSNDGGWNKEEDPATTATDEPKDSNWG